jgi:hypothetical protein
MAGCEPMKSWLRTELRTVAVLRSRALGPVLTSTARGLWSVLLRFGPLSGAKNATASPTRMLKALCTPPAQPQAPKMMNAKFCGAPSRSIGRWRRGKSAACWSEEAAVRTQLRKKKAKSRIRSRGLKKRRMRFFFPGRAGARPEPAARGGLVSRGAWGLRRGR